MNDGDCNRRTTRKVPLLDLQKLKVICALGRGAKGVVFLVKSEDGELLALKAISRASIEKNKKNDEHVSEYKRICFEKDVLASLEHPLFPMLRGLISTEQIVGYAIDYCPGRDLNTLRKKQTEKMFSDDIIRFYAAELVLALEYLHGLGIVYRDLKPENVMIQENGHLMLIDFDLSTRLQPKTPDTRRVMQSSSSPRSMQGQNNKKIKKLASFFKRYYSRLPETDSIHPVELDSDSASHSSQSQNVEKSNSFVGTEEYVAPEIISGKGHDFAVDWWCLGVMLYEMLYGTTPFRGVNRKETFYRILTKVPELVGEPTPLRNLIGKLLEKDPKRRITVEEIKQHDFFEAVDWDRILEIPRPPFIPVSEHTEGNKQIDVESFVQGVFKVGDNDDEKKVENKNKGVWAEGLNNPTNNQNELYSIF